jgi:hypothetical protein
METPGNMVSQVPDRLGVGDLDTAPAGADLYRNATGIEGFGRGGGGPLWLSGKGAIFALAECGAEVFGTQQKSLFELARVQMGITTSSVCRVSKR